MADPTIRRILMLDDEERILKALARRVKTIHPEWEIATIADAREALTYLETNECDLVVSDLQMPGMDGGEFLSRVRQAHPKIIRFALSGHAQQELMLRAIGLTHQYFSKPCDTVVLTKSIEQALESGESMRETRLKELVVKLCQFPPFPAIYDKLMIVLNDPTKDLEKVCDVVRKDPAITSKILQVSNSSFYGFSRKIGEVKEAISLLGLESVKTLALVFKFMDGVPVAQTSDLNQEELWSHSVNVGVLAGKLATDVFGQPAKKDELVTLALLHDLGKWILANYSPERFAKAIHNAQEAKISSWNAELAEFEITHAEVGAMLFKMWGLPESITEVVRCHHEPMKTTLTDVSCLAMLHLADNIEYNYFSKKEAFNAACDNDFLTRHGFFRDKAFWDNWVESLKEE